MPSALFVGNGLNRCSGALCSWDGLLHGLAEEYEVLGAEQDVFSLEFERILNCALQKRRLTGDRAFYRIKRQIGKSMMDKRMRPTALHNDFVNLPVDAFLTTNYDYLLERAIDPDLCLSSLRSGSQEVKYSLHRKQRAGGRAIYHIHGEACAPSSICLGFEHYTGALVRLREHLLVHDSGEKDVSILNVLRGCKKPSGCFGELFFTHDLYFIGYGLDQAEIDVWWLLTYRAFLLHTDYRGMAAYIKNRIVFYDVGPDDARSRQRRSLLECLHVETMRIDLPGGDYSAGYRTALQDLKENQLGDRTVS